MAFVNVRGYGFADLFDYFKGNFFVLYLRGLYRFYFGGHSITSTLNLMVFRMNIKGVRGKNRYSRYGSLLLFPKK